MLAKVVNENVFSNVEVISLSGKLWVYEAPYDFELDEKLKENEELYYIRSHIIYRVKFGSKIIEINGIEFAPGKAKNDPINTLREIAKTMADAVPDNTTVKIQDNNIILHTGSNEREYEFPVFLSDKRRNHPSVAFVTKEIFDKYGEVYKKLQKSKTSYRGDESNSMIISFGKYFILSFPTSAAIFDIDTVMSKKDPIAFIYTTETYVPVKECDVLDYFYRISFPEGEAILSEKTVFYSPSKVPKNAFIISTSGDFLQFTKKGIVATKGIYFAKEDIGEFKNPCYIVEKTKDGWDIYVLLRDYKGHYRISGNKLYRYPILYADRDGRNVVYVDYYPIYVEDGKLKSYYSAERKLSDIFERVKIVLGDKVLYVPKKFVSSWLFD